jgi:hypothetical protein
LSLKDPFSSDARIILALIKENVDSAILLMGLDDEYFKDF